MKSEWANHIRETRKAVNRKRKREKNLKGEISYKEAMKIASTTWEAKKRKLERKWKKEAKLVTKTDKDGPKVVKGSLH